MKYAIRNRFIEAVEGYIKPTFKHDNITISEAVGISEKEFVAILKKEEFIPSDVIAKFLMAYPEIDGEWLLMGWDTMIKVKEKSSHTNNYTFNNEGNVTGDGNTVGSTIEIDKAKQIHKESLIEVMEKNIKLQENMIQSLTGEVEALKGVLKEKGIK